MAVYLTLRRTGNGSRHRCTRDFRAAVEAHFAELAKLAITPDIEAPEQEHGVVSGARKASARLATIALVPEIPAEGSCPKAARLLTGPQMHLPWPSQADDLPTAVRYRMRKLGYFSRQDR